jgi:hypothetical protein
MKKLIILLALLIPAHIFAFVVVVPTDTTGGKNDAMTNLVFACRVYYKGDTIVNLNSLNNGIKSYQISDESKRAITNNGLKITDGAIVVLEFIDSLKKDFQFDVKTIASDAEYYENTIKVKVKNKDIRLVNVTSDKIEMATGFRKEGKIYVVITVSMILFFTVIGYLIYLERKTRKMEKELKGK